MRKALVTGGNRGIGRAIAKGLSADHHVIVASRNISEAQVVADEIGGSAIELDLTKKETLKQVRGLDVDVLINNAGELGHGALLEHSGELERLVDIMVVGPLALIRQTVPHMKAQKFGRIVNVSSGWGSFSEGMAGPSNYAMAKSALNAMTKVLPRELPANVTVNAMCPGWVRTRMGGRAAPMTPEEGADTAIWLARQKAGGPTGQFFRHRKVISW